MFTNIHGFYLYLWFYNNNKKNCSIISTMTQKVTVNGKLNLEVEDEEHFSSEKIIYNRTKENDITRTFYALYKTYIYECTS